MPNLKKEILELFDELIYRAENQFKYGNKTNIRDLYRQIYELKWNLQEQEITDGKKIDG